MVVLLVAPMLQGLFALPDAYAKSAFYAVWLSMSISGMLILEINTYVSSGAFRVLAISSLTGATSMIIMWKLSLKTEERTKIKEIFFRRLSGSMRQL